MNTIDNNSAMSNLYNEAYKSIIQENLSLFADESLNKKSEKEMQYLIMLLDYLSSSVYSSKINTIQIDANDHNSSTGIQFSIYEVEEFLSKYNCN